MEEANLLSLYVYTESNYENSDYNGLYVVIIEHRIGQNTRFVSCRSICLVNEKYTRIVD